MAVRPFDAWVFRLLLFGESLNGELDALPEPFGRVARHLDGLSVENRTTAFQGFLAGREDGDEFTRLLAEADPTGPPPTLEDADESCATLADLRRLISDTTWPWPGWLAAAVLNALAADPGTGKTIMAADLARRLWFGELWPDGQVNPFPKRTRTLWVPGDRHYPQLIELADKYGLPDEALLLNAPRSDPTGGLDLDDPAELDALARRIKATSPGLVIVDTVGMTTARNLCRPEDARAYFGPLMDLAQRIGVLFLLLTHLSREAEALGRRIVGACRVVWKMTAPDPDGQPDRRRVWVDKSYAVKPPPLGMTIAAAGCSFDFNPPSAPEPTKPGRPPQAREKAEAFVREALTRANDRIGNELCAEWEKLGGSAKTFWRAVGDLESAGELATEGGPGTRKQKMLHLNRTEIKPEPEGSPQPEGSPETEAPPETEALPEADPDRPF